MSAVVEALSELLNFPETIEKFVLSSPRPNDADHRRGGGGSAASFPADILDAPSEYVFYMDVPGLSKSDIQVTVEEENTLVIKSNGKRKREDGEGEEGCKYVRLERRPIQKLTRKFKLPENANVSAITAKCENGVLTVVVKKLPPPPNPKTVEVAIS
ncbi:17.4 kDa class iii heat shock protein [Phtheirospermum japonicum]|uniref:17.4 kDa class iii heat shock protein n=1 Tax=Phtheirospermum japonicum TaxID=374723 RepID=A0A830CFG5_9LAMI|nr:17.4 kDa class iii heat shock protein [Phtheirospermum japonicum]